MNILIVGAGGREHAFAWKMAQSPACGRLFVAPGNAGTAQVATNLPLAVTDFDGLAAAVLEHGIGLVVVGPEEPLVRGIRDYFESRPDLQHVGLVGPGQAGAQLEGSKDFSKQFMQRHSIPTARYQTFRADQLAQGLDYLQGHPLPVVLKADGLAAGKGVIIAETHDDARHHLHDMLAGQRFGEASGKVVVEAFLQGIELSVFVLTDGTDYVLLPEAKDYKRIGEGDTGPNTGGMGAVSPVAFADAAFLEKVKTRIVAPTLAGLRAEGIAYVGFVFIGLMNVGGEPYVIEYNCRMGDPETEAVLPRIETDLVTLLKAAATGRLGQVPLEVSPQAAVTTVLVAGGYPGEYTRGDGIQMENLPADALFFHAGTKTDAAGNLLTNGGRVLAVTALAPTPEQARQASQQAAATLRYQGQYFRRDIGLDLLSTSA